MPPPSSKDPLDWIESADPDRLWVIDDQGAQTYGELLRNVRAMAGRFAVLGIKPGDRIAAKIGKSRDAVHLYLACLWTGAIYLPLNEDYTAKEIDYFLKDAEPVLFVVPPGSNHKSGEVMRIGTLGVRGEGTMIAVYPADIGPRHRFPANTVAAMLYTSGTTGKPKGAMLTRGNLASSAAPLVKAWKFTQDDILIHALPIFHVHGLFVAINTVLAAGASMRLLPKFSPDKVLRHFRDSTVLMGVPTFYTRLLDIPGLARDKCGSMRLFVSGSAPLLAETHRAFQELTGHAILERYGMTETMMNTSNPYQGARVPGTVGPALPGVSLRVSDPETGHPVPEDTIGMIEVKGPNVFKGYWRNPEKTASAFREDGYFITGDLGKVDPDGYVHIMGRGKDLIISGGLNIYPKEVEEVIDALPGVTESAVIGVRHPDFGEAVVAIVVGVPELEETAMIAALSGDLARFKLPKAIRFVPKLPRNAMGKVQKAALRTAHRKLFAG